MYLCLYITKSTLHSQALLAELKRVFPNASEFFIQTSEQKDSVNMRIGTADDSKIYENVLFYAEGWSSAYLRHETKEEKAPKQLKFADLIVGDIFKIAGENVHRMKIRTPRSGGEGGLEDSTLILSTKTVSPCSQIVWVTRDEEHTHSITAFYEKNEKGAAASFQLGDVVTGAFFTFLDSHDVFMKLEPMFEYKHSFMRLCSRQVSHSIPTARVLLHTPNQLSSEESAEIVRQYSPKGW